ncbi:MAG: hypothetical protein BECKG1743F_GA0114225_106632 [Candidatus Kentron sp. G]|nr:MAG: hypothetical protein BECKG1743F_GA0114225_106632 [Candidatus Kentron sp. G]
MGGLKARRTGYTQWRQYTSSPNKKIRPPCRTWDVLPRKSRTNFVPDRDNNAGSGSRIIEKPCTMRAGYSRESKELAGKPPAYWERASNRVRFSRNSRRIIKLFDENLRGTWTNLPLSQPPIHPKAISIKEYTNLLVFIVQLLRCNNSYIVNDAPAARLESGRKSCAIRYILFCQSPKVIAGKEYTGLRGPGLRDPGLRDKFI